MSGIHEIRDCLRFSVEDRFLILNLWEPTAMLPTGLMLEDIAGLIGTFIPEYSLVCDARSIEAVTTDLVEFIGVIEDYGPIILVDKTKASWLLDELRYRHGISLKSQVLPLRGNPPNFELCDFPLPPSPINNTIGLLEEARWENVRSEIDCEAPLTELEFMLLQTVWPIKLGNKWPTHGDFIASLNSRSLRSYDAQAALGTSYVEFIFARRWIEAKIPILAHRSLLTEFALQVVGDKIVTIPYHGLALHEVESQGELILGRPSVLAARTNAILSRDFELFNELLSRHPKEAEIQHFLEAFPQVLRSLGYLNIYPQVVLHRDDGSSLRPDFILQPIGDEWCDILDIKIPQAPTVVGGRDRKTLAACVHALVAQLREYGAYFEDPKYARRIEEKYGIKCYRPRLVGITGRSVDFSDERQLRRLMTAYDDVRLISFDQLLEVARRRILI